VNGIERWEVNLQDSRRVLTVQSDGASEDDIVEAVESVGFDAEKL
jgi:copper chaperone